MHVCYPTNPHKNLEAEIGFAAREGFDSVELFLEEGLCDPDGVRVSTVRKRLDEFRYDPLGHVSPRLPIGSPIHQIRRACVEELKRYLDVFDDLNVGLLTVHADWRSGNGAFGSRRLLEFQVETLTRLVRVTRRYGMKLMIEPSTTPEDSIQNMNSILRMVRGLRMNLDLGHAHLGGKNPVDFIDVFHRKIAHVHLHDNNGSEDQHLPLGVGKIRWSEVMQTLKSHYDNSITPEVFVADPRWLLLTCENVREMWESSAHKTSVR